MSESQNNWFITTIVVFLLLVGGLVGVVITAVSYEQKLTKQYEIVERQQEQIDHMGELIGHLSEGRNDCLLPNKTLPGTVIITDCKTDEGKK